MPAGVKTIITQLVLVGASAAAAAAIAALVPALRKRGALVDRSYARSLFLLCAGMAAFAVVFTYLANLRFDAFMAAAVDLGIQHQVFWAGGRGGFLYQTVILGKPHLNHVALITRFLSYISVAYSSPRFLFAIQSLALASAALPAFFLARRFTPSNYLAAAFGFSLLFLVTAQSLTLYDFHERTFGPAFLLWALWCVEVKRTRGALFFSFLTLLLLEEFGLYVAAIGLYIALGLKRRKLGFALAGAAAAHFFLSTYVIYPQLMDMGGPASNPILNTFGVSSSPLGLVAAFVRKPLDFLGPASNPARWAYVVQMGAPWGFLSAATSWGWLTFATPLLYALFSVVPTHYNLNFQYAVAVVPFLIYFAMRAWARWVEKRMSARPRRLAWARRAMAAYLILIGVANAVAFGPLGLARNPQVFRAARWTASWHRVSSYISPTRSVAASMFILPHLTNRWRAYLFPHQFRRHLDLFPHEVVVRTSTFTDPGTPEPWVFPSKFDWERDWKRYVLVSLLRERSYGCVYADREIVILRRGVTPIIPSEELFKNLFQIVEDRDVSTGVGVRIFDDRARDRTAIFCPRDTALLGTAASTNALYWPVGKVRVTCRMAAEAPTGFAVPIAELVVNEVGPEGGERPVGVKTVSSAELPTDGSYGDVALAFYAKGLNRYRFHVYGYERADLLVDYFLVEAETLTLKDAYVLARSTEEEAALALGRVNYDDPFAIVPEGFQLR